MIADSPARGRRRYQNAKVFLGLVISALCLWWAVQGLLDGPDAWKQISSAFRTADYRSLPVILILLFVFYWLKAWRWRLLLRPVGLFKPLKQLFGPIMIGFAFNNVLPAHMGELIRMNVFSKKYRVPFAISASTVVLERVFDGMAIVTYFALGLLFIEGLDPRIQQGAMMFSVMAMGVVLASLSYVLWTPTFLKIYDAVVSRIPLLPRSLSDKIRTMLEQGAQGLSALKNWRIVVVVMLISYVKWALNGALVLLSLWSFNLPHTIPIAMLLLGTIAFAVTIPSSPGYIGVMQVVFKEVMQFFTTESEAVFAASIFYLLTQWVPVTLTGLIYFAATGMNLKLAEEIPSPPESSMSETLSAPQSH